MMALPSTTQLCRPACQCGAKLRRGAAPPPGAQQSHYHTFVAPRGVLRVVASATASSPLRPWRPPVWPRTAADEARVTGCPAPSPPPQAAPQQPAGPSHHGVAQQQAPQSQSQHARHAPHAPAPATAAPPQARSPGPHAATITVGDGTSLSAAAAAAAAVAALRHPIPAAHLGAVPTAGLPGLPALPTGLPGGGGAAAGAAGGAAAGAASSSGSHTEPASARLAAHGCYRVLGPAVIRRRGDTLVARLLPGARLELMEADGAAAAMRPAFEAPAPSGGAADSGAAAAGGSRSGSRSGSSSGGSSGSSGSMDGPVDLASLGVVISSSPGGGGGGGGAGMSRDDSGLGVDLPLRRCLMAAAAGDSLDGDAEKEEEEEEKQKGDYCFCGHGTAAAAAAAMEPRRALLQPNSAAAAAMRHSAAGSAHQQHAQRAGASESTEVEQTEVEEAPADEATRRRYLAAAAAGWGAQPPLPAAYHHQPHQPHQPPHVGHPQQQQYEHEPHAGQWQHWAALEGGGGGADEGAAAALLRAGCDDDEDDGAVAECVLVAAHVELGGSACGVDLLDADLQSAVTRHNGHTYLSVRQLPYNAVITLNADGDLSHPVNVTPHQQPQAQPQQQSQP